MSAPRSLRSVLVLVLRTTYFVLVLGLACSCSLSVSGRHRTPTRPGSIAGDSEALARKIKHGSALELALVYARPDYASDVRTGAFHVLSQLSRDADTASFEQIRTTLEGALLDPLESVRVAAFQALSELERPADLHTGTAEQRAGTAPR
jgi:hypothetical protein